MVVALQILSQRDSKWASQKLGWGETNTSTIGSHGCTITCISMLGGLTPDVANKGFIAHKAYAAHKDTPKTFNLIYWERIPLAFPHITFEWRSYAYDNEKVKATIEKNGGCLVEVDGTKIGGSRHWVLYIGGGRMYDPWTGTEKATTYYPAVGYAILNVQKTTPEVKPEVKTYSEAEMTTVRLERDKNWNLYQEAKADYEQQKTIAEETKKELSTFTETLASKLSVVVDKNEVIGATERLLEVENQRDSLLREKEQQEKKHALERDELKLEIKQLREAIEQQQIELDLEKKQNNTLLTRIDQMETKMSQLGTQDVVVSSSRVMGWIKSLFGKQ